jgi:hypothetical protein
MIHFFNMRIVAERKKLQQVVGEVQEESFQCGTQCGTHKSEDAEKPPFFAGYETGEIVRALSIYIYAWRC